MLWFAGKRWMLGEKTNVHSLAAMLSQQQRESLGTRCQHHHSPGMRKEQGPAPLLHQGNPLVGASSRPEIPRLCVTTWPWAQTEGEMPAFFLNQQLSHLCYGSIHRWKKLCMWPCSDFRKEVQLIFIRCFRLQFYKQMEHASTNTCKKSSWLQEFYTGKPFSQDLIWESCAVLSACASWHHWIFTVFNCY